MTDGRNWYIILELEFYPNPVNDEDVIRERIDEKSKFWSRNANNFQHKELLFHFHLNVQWHYLTSL